LDGQSLRKITGDRAAGLPGSQLEQRSNPNWDLYKVRGKVFMLMTDMPGHPVVILKGEPDCASSTRRSAPGIT
jgi:predicted DNA-binding protein (MmcQ/YjbR family)